MQYHIPRALLGLLLAGFMFASCTTEEDGGGGGGGGEPCELTATPPAFGTAVFSAPTTINNGFFPLTPGNVNVYRLSNGEDIETVVVTVTANTPTVNGVVCVEVSANEYVDDLLVEETLDWYAQDNSGNVWYFGEDVTNYVYDDNDNLIGTNTNGSWEAGLDLSGTGTNAIAGVIMPATPTVGFTYYQEYYPTQAMDIAQVFAVGVTVTLTDGRIFPACLQTLECNPLEEDSHEYKYYAGGIGLIREEAIADAEFTDLRGTFVTGATNVPNFAGASFSAPTTINHARFPLTPGDSYTYRAVTDEGVETVVVDVLNQTQVVNGITCRVVRDRVYLDGRLVEDTFDWYCQDNAGNVWYMGEDVTNYQYDAAGALVGSDSNGSWEAGVGGAQPGLQMIIAPVAGDRYEQEYWAGQAEDVAEVISASATVNLSNGTVYTNCLQTIDWNPLDPSVLEYKFYDSGTGLVMETHIDEPEVAELTLKTP